MRLDPKRDRWLIGMQAARCLRERGSEIEKGFEVGSMNWSRDAVVRNIETRGCGRHILSDVVMLCLLWPRIFLFLGESPENEYLYALFDVRGLQQMA